jgi:uncharacterized membrane protein
MAGIGFKLQRILSERNYLDTMKGYSFAAAISSGPWLLTVLAMGGLSLLLLSRMRDQLEIFQCLLVHVYAYSLIITGIFQQVVTRYISDRLYEKDEDAVLPTFTAILLMNTVLLVAASSAFLYGSGLSARELLLSVLLFAVVGNIWLLMLLLTTLRDYRSVGVAFLVGAIVSFGAAWGFSPQGLSGLLGGYLLGQSVLALLLLRQVFREFRIRRRMDPFLDHYYFKRPALILIGFTYNLGIWVDKFIFWHSEQTGQVVLGPLRGAPLYDSVVFLAYLTAVPAMSLFLIRIETSFYASYRDFYGAITNRMPLAVIQEKKALMVSSLLLSIQRLVVLQGFICLTGILLLPRVMDRLGLQWSQTHILQITLVGVFLQSLFLIGNIFVQYFDFLRTSSVLVVLFCGLNALFSWMTLQKGLAWYGYGFFAASLVSVVAVYIALVKIIDSLEYHTFMSQEIRSAEHEDPVESPN